VDTVVSKNNWHYFYVITDTPVLTPVIVSPTTLQHVSSFMTHSPSSDKTTGHRITHTRHQRSDEHVSNSQTLSQMPLPITSSSSVRLATSSSMMHKEVALMPQDARNGELEPPVVGRKFQGQVRNDADANEDGDHEQEMDLYMHQQDEETYEIPPPRDVMLKPPSTEDDDDDGDDDDDDEGVYNYPRQDLYKPYLTGFQQDEETSDSGSRFEQHAPASYDDIYDLPPKPHGCEAIGLNTHDDVYDFPPTNVSVNVTNDSVPLATQGVASHHIYANVASLVSVDITGSEFSSMKHTDRLSANSEGSDHSENDEIMVSSRTRSFRSTNSRYVLNFDFEI